MKVLLIGSDRDIVLMTGKILTRNQYDVSTAIGPAEGIAMLRGGSFDLVLLDHETSEAECSSVIRAVKQNPSAPRLLLISENREDEVPLLKAGADDWIRKPYQMNVLLARMAALLRQKQQADQPRGERMKEV